MRSPQGIRHGGGRGRGAARGRLGRRRLRRGGVRLLGRRAGADRPGRRRLPRRATTPRARRPLALDCFVAVPGEGHGGGRSRRSSPTSSTSAPGSRSSSSGPGSCAVPGVTAGLEDAHRRLGRLPWAELARPAIALARAGVELTPAHADVIDAAQGLPRRLARGRARVRAVRTPAARRRAHEQPAARRHARAHRRPRRARAGRRRDGARDRRPPGRDGRAA